MSKTRKKFGTTSALLASAIGASVLSGCSGSAPGLNSCEGVTVETGITSSLSDALMYIALDRGYFAEEGLDVQLRAFKSAGEMTPYLAAGHLSVGAGAPTAGFYNGIDRGIDIEIVADKGQLVENFDYMPMLVSKALYDSGRIRSVQDLEGHSLAEPAPATATSSTASALLENVGLSYDSVNHTYLGFSNHVSALQNGSVDASLTTEPAASQAIASGAAVKLADSTEVYGGQQLAVLLYSGSFSTEEKSAAQCFMTAYTRAAGEYSAATAGGEWTGPGADDIVGIIANNIGATPEAVRNTVPGYVDPTAALNTDSLVRDYQFFVEQGFYQGESEIDFSSLVNTEFVDAAADAASRGE